MYFGALEKLKEVQEDLGKLDDVKHVRRVIKLFLIQWGNMNRVVGRKSIEWNRLGETLRNLEKGNLANSETRNSALSILIIRLSLTQSIPFTQN
jgi:hypothetical protein